MRPSPLQCLLTALAVTMWMSGTALTLAWESVGDAVADMAIVPAGAAIFDAYIRRDVRPLDVRVRQLGEQVEHLREDLQEHDAQAARGIEHVNELAEANMEGAQLLQRMMERNPSGPQRLKNFN
jgi:hypothetical protein